MARRKRKRKKDRRKRTRRPSFKMPIPGRVQAQIEELLEGEQLEEALEIVDEWLERRPDHPDLCFYAGCAHGMLGDPSSALMYYRRSYRQDPRNEAILHNLVPVYMKLGFFAHLLRNLDRYLRTEMASEQDDIGQFLGLKAETEKHEREAAAYFGVDAERYLEAHYWNEEAQIAQQEGNWNGAIASANKALDILPDHAPALNNRATSFLYAGRLDEAIADEEGALSLDPKNVHALTNLIRFYHLRGRREDMQDCFARLQVLSPDDWEHQAEPIAKMLEAYALAGTDEEVYAFLRQHADEVPSRGRYMLGAAAANLGRTREARRAWQEVEDDGATWKSLAERALQAHRDGMPGLGRASRFPYTALQEFATRSHMEQLMGVIEKHEGDAQVRHKGIADMVARHPGLLETARWFLWYSDDAMQGIRILALLGTEEAWAELETFAQGKAGTDKERMEAVQVLAQEGRLSTDEPVPLWVRGEWTKVQRMQFEITDEITDVPYSEKVVDLLGRAGLAHQDGDLDEAEGIYRRILELHPDCCPAHNNLGQIAGQRGDTDTMYACMEKALEIDPDYLMARCNLAQLYADEGQVERAMEMIAPLAGRTRFAPFEMRAYYLAQAHIQLQRGDFEAAENIQGILAEIDPDDPAVEDLTELVNRLQPFGNLLKRIRENTRKNRDRKDARHLDADASLETCLDRHIKDALLGIARGMDLSGIEGYRKAEMVDSVAESLRRPDALRRIVSALPDRAREALNDVLEQGGAMPWDTFTKRHGSDREESAYGSHAEPKTPMGQLRMAGLLYVGTRAGEKQVQVPAELRATLQTLEV